MASSQIDPALISLLSLDASKTTISSHGGAGMSSASTCRISTILSSGLRKDYFMKTGSGNWAEVMFEGESASLNALHNAVPSLCPRSYGWGKFEDGSGKSFLVTDFLDLNSGRSSANSKGASTSLAQKMARLHTTPAPIPEGHDKPMFGFPVKTCCADTPQSNAFTTSWADFYANRRLRFILDRSQKANGSDDELAGLVEETASTVVPRLLRDGHLGGDLGIKPVVVHGDLWSGNSGRGTIMDGGEEEARGLQDVVYDPSASFCHGEYELGIMKMFGGFGSTFFKEYHDVCPRTEPVDEYDDRISLYELYHQLNHHALFGGGYRSELADLVYGVLFHANIP
jgi:protein-ribulosamine 3-kinase